MKFEAMCKTYAHAAKDLDALYYQVKSSAETQSLALSTTYTARRDEIVRQRNTVLSEVESDWTRYLDLHIEQFEGYLAQTVQMGKRELDEITDSLNNYPVGFFLLFPKGWELMLRRKRLEGSISSFEAARRLWHVAERRDVNTLRQVLDVITEKDPADLVVRKILPFCEKIADARSSIMTKLEGFLQEAQTTLQKIVDEFTAAAKALDLSVANQLEPSFLHVQGLNDALIKEADMIGKKVNTR